MKNRPWVFRNRHPLRRQRATTERCACGRFVCGAAGGACSICATRDEIKIDRRICRGCGNEFVWRKQGGATFCSRTCYESPYRHNRSSSNIYNFATIRRDVDYLLAELAPAWFSAEMRFDIATDIALGVRRREFGYPIERVVVKEHVEVAKRSRNRDGYGTVSLDAPVGSEDGWTSRGKAMGIY